MKKQKQIQIRHCTYNVTITPCLITNAHQLRRRHGGPPVLPAPLGSVPFNRKLLKARAWKALIGRLRKELLHVFRCFSLPIKLQSSYTKLRGTASAISQTKEDTVFLRTHKFLRTKWAFFPKKELLVLLSLITANCYAWGAIYNDVIRENPLTTTHALDFLKINLLAKNKMPFEIELDFFLDAPYVMWHTSPDFGVLLLL